ncbi:hypothetical protein ELH08_37875 (plasmid) [Rhizobium ruizarguesonis]|nr:hypothetical protein ELH08_37875 [Rhizobium ruizarguesonis]
MHRQARQAPADANSEETGHAAKAYDHRATAGFASYGEKSCWKIRIYRGYLNMNYRRRQSVLQCLHIERINGHDLR